MPLPFRRTSLTEARARLDRSGTVSLRGSIAMSVAMGLCSWLLLLGCGAGMVWGVREFGTGWSAWELVGVLSMFLGVLLFGFGAVLWPGRLVTASRAVVIEKSGLRIDGSNPIPWDEIRGFSVVSHRAWSAVVVEMTGGAYVRVRPSLAIPLRWIPARQSVPVGTVQVQHVPGLSSWQLQEFLGEAWLRLRRPA